MNVTVVVLVAIIVVVIAAFAVWYLTQQQRRRAELREQFGPEYNHAVETYGERGEKPTRHLGLRVWVVPNHVQVDSTLGFENTNPERRFYTVGLRLLW